MARAQVVKALINSLLLNTALILPRPVTSFRPVRFLKSAQACLYY